MLSMKFSRQEYWNGLPVTFPGDLPYPGIEPGSLHFRQILYHLIHLPGSRVALFVLLQGPFCCCSGLYHDHYQFTLPQKVQETSISSPFYPSGVVCRHFEDVPADWWKVSLMVLFICFPLIITNMQHLLLSYFPFKKCNENLPREMEL